MAKIDEIKDKVFDEHINVISDKKKVSKVFDEKRILTLVREKKINMSLLSNTKSHLDYNDHVSRAQIYLHSNSKCLAQEEYDLLKEWNDYYESERS